MYGMEKAVRDNYGLEVYNITQYKDSLLMNSSKGKKVCARLLLSAERILFIHGAKEHLARNGFIKTDRYNITNDGAPYISVDNANYVLLDYREGRECNFDDDKEILNAAKVLARLHFSSKGYFPDGKAKVQDELGNLPGCFSKRLEDIKKLKKQAKKGKSRFDQLFVEYADGFINAAESALSGLTASNYYKLVENARNERSFCHHDFTHNNIIVDEDDMTINNFDFCCFELRIYDLANLIRRKMRKSSWNIDKAKALIDAYSSISELSSDEICVMKYMLMFPQKLWRVLNRYYNSRRSWSERSYLEKLQEVVEEIQEHKHFMEQFT